MLKRESGKLSFQGMDVAKDPLRILRMVGLHELDDATLLGALLSMKARLSQPSNMEDAHNKGREALRVLAERKV